MNEGKDQEQDNIIKQDISKELSKNQVILYSLIITGAITVFILSMIGINPFILLIIIGVVLVYVYFDKDIQSESTSESIKNENAE